MYSFGGKSQSNSSSYGSHMNFGGGSSNRRFSRSLRDPRIASRSTNFSSFSFSSNSSSSSYSPTWPPNNPSWTAKSWISTGTSSSGGFGNRSSDSYVFQDLAGSATGQGKSGIGGKVPLKSAAQKSTFSTGSRGSQENWANYFPNSGSRIGNPIAQPVKPAGRAPSTKHDRARW